MGETKMNPIDQIAAKLPLSKDTLARNPHLNINNPIVEIKSEQGKRVRQSSKPALNKLETEFKNYMLALCPSSVIHEQSVTVKLGNGVRYTPDLFMLSDDYADYGERPTFFEVKGPHAFDGALEKLKIAAGMYPEFTWILVWKDAGIWMEQVILK